MRSRPLGVSHLLSSVILLGVAAVPIAEGQTHDSTWVRITVTERGWTRKLVGTLREAGPDSLILMKDNRHPVVVPRAGVQAFEQWAGTKSAVGRDAVRGLGIGAGVGLIGSLVAIAATSGSSCSGFLQIEPQCEPGAWFVGGVAVGAFLGTIVGATIGGLNRTDRWSPAAMPAQASLTVSPGRIGLRLPVSFRGL